jgi:hypothetical protein
MIGKILWQPAVAERIAKYASPANFNAFSCCTPSIRCLLKCHQGREVADCLVIADDERVLADPGFECIDRCVVPSSPRLQAQWPAIEAIERLWPPSRCFFLKHTMPKGWGVYARVSLPANTAVCAYVGEVVRTTELLQRRQHYDEEGLNYVLTAREITPVCAVTLCVCSGRRLTIASLRSRMCRTVVC